MTEWIVRDDETGNERTFNSKSEAQQAQEQIEAEFGINTTLVPPQATDGGSAVSQVVDTAEDKTPTESAQLPESQPMSDDPLSWIPSDFVDTIEGTPAINRKGFAVLKQHYDISVDSECVVGPEETDFEFCRVAARAESPDGTISEAHGSAHVDRGDDPWLLLEMADTRAKKRALSDATGVGMCAVEELKNQ